MTARLPLSVVVPTLGRPGLHRCLRSVADCDPAPAEVVVVAQAGGPEARRVVDGLGLDGARVVDCDGRGVARATNAGLRAADRDVVLVTHDDCTVAPDWAAVAWAHMTEEPAGIVTGRVLPAGDAQAVPSCKVDLRPRDFTGELHYGVLYPNNMVVPRVEVLGMGGFDERPSLLVAEDLDLCYRWLKEGRPLRYRPDMTVRHHDWRTRDELVRTYSSYARGQGAFFAKHLRAGDWRMLAYLARTVSVGLRGVASAAGRPRSERVDERLGILPGLPRGLYDGWRDAGGPGGR